MTPENATMGTESRGSAGCENARGLKKGCAVPVLAGGRQPGGGQPPCQAGGAVAAQACGPPEGWQGDERASRTRAELSDPRTLAPDRGSLAGGGLAASGPVARALAAALSPGSSTACGKAAAAAQTAGTTAGQTAQTQGGSSCGARQRQTGGLKNLPV
jgi:hypothetical protein